MSFVHLHTHSEFSMLDSLARVTDIFARAQEHGAPALAVTDHGTLGGIWQAKKAADQTGVKLIAGLEAYLAIGSRYERDKIEVLADDAASEGDDSGDKGDEHGGLRFKQRAYEHITILARNRSGWLNLVKLQNESSKHIAGRAKLIDFDLLAEHSDGLMVLTGCVGGPVFGPVARAGQMEELLSPLTSPDSEVSPEQAAQALELIERIDAEKQRARTNLERLMAAVGRENVYLEVMEHGNAPEQAALEALRALAREYDLPLVATNDCHYTDADDRTAHGAWLAVQTKKTIATQTFTFHGSGYHLRTAEEMAALRAEGWWQDACAQTLTIAERVEPDAVPEPQDRLPSFPIPDGFEHENYYLRHLLAQGIEQKLGTLDDTYRARINTELDVIFAKGFVSYFLIVWDLIAWARANGIYIGAGRGSAAGSLVAYLLDITRVDPIEYDLLFERFLDPGRTDFPDIDIDVESRYRGKLIAYLGEKWGAENVAQIGTVGKNQVRGSWKEGLKVLGAAPSLADKTGELIPADLKMSELLSSRQDPRLTEFWREFDKISYADRALQLAASFYQVAKLSSIHAGGVIISPEPLDTMIPMRWAEANKGAGDYRWITEWDYPDCESFGLVKFDLLGIRNLDMAHVAIDSVRDRLGENITLENIPHPDHDHEDPRVQRAFHMLREGRTAGVFQLESPAMTELLENVGPDTLTELSSVIALFRPGPLSAGMHTRYADRKHGREPVSYDYLTTDPGEAAALAQVFGNTYGVLVFQEQIMQLGRVVAGFDDAWKSKLRKAVSKKNAVLMAEVEDKFLAGAGQAFTDETGEVFSPMFSEATARNVWDAMKGSAAYLFNKCLAGDTQVVTENRRTYTIEQLYYLLHGGMDVPEGRCHRCGSPGLVGFGKRFGDDGVICFQCYEWLQYQETNDTGIRLMAWSSKSGSLHGQALKDVHQLGVKPVKELFLFGGQIVRATDNHRFMTPDGYKHVRDLKVGDLLIVQRAWHEPVPSRILTITDMGEEVVYDVEMADGTDHNFLANGIVSHNSHSDAYAVLAFITAYLKANYPGDYGAATLTVTGGDKKDKRVGAMHALIGEGINITAPSVNSGQAITSPVSDGQVQIGLGEIKGVGDVAHDIVREREEHGPYTSLEDMIDRVQVGDTSTRLSTAQLDALIDSGACDEFGPRYGLHMVARSGDMAGLDVPPVEFSPIELGVRQSGRLLMTLDEHVRREVQSTLVGWQRPSHGGFHGPKAIPVGQLADAGLEDGAYAYVSGILTSYSEKDYSKGVMGRMSIQDVDGDLDGVIWEEQRAKAKDAGDIPPPGFPVVLYGRLETRSFSVRDTADEDGEDKTVTRRQISIQGVYPIDVDLSLRVLAPAGPLPRLTLTERESAPAASADGEEHAADGDPDPVPAVALVEDADPAILTEELPPLLHAIDPPAEDWDPGDYDAPPPPEDDDWGQDAWNGSWTTEAAVAVSDSDGAWAGEAEPGAVLVTTPTVAAQELEEIAEPASEATVEALGPPVPPLIVRFGF
ncbi:DNA polymerase III subunit alpha [Leucobacter sp. HY1910]